LRPAAGPRFDVDVTGTTGRSDVAARRSSTPAVSSVDASSTTITSSGRLVCPSSAMIRRGRRWALLYVVTTTETESPTGPDIRTIFAALPRARCTDRGGDPR
jgi:hypothetical protein